MNLFTYIKNREWDKIITILKDDVNNTIDINIKDSNNNYLLQYAVLYNNIELTKILLSKKCKIDIIDIDNRCILYYPVKYDYVDILLLILQHNNNNIGISIIDIQDKDGNTPLHYSIFFTNIQIITKLLKYGSDVNIKNNRGYNALHMAVYTKDLNICKIILQQHIDINDVTNTGETALHLATNYQLYDICELLLTNNINYNIYDFENELVPIVYSIILNNNSIFSLFLKFNISLDIQDVYGNSILHYIIMENNLYMFDKIIVYDFNINTYNIDSKTPFHIIFDTINNNTIHYIRQLITKSDINIQDNNGNTIMHLLCKSNLWNDIQDKLITKNINIFIKNKNEQTALDLITDTNDKDKFITMIAKSYLYHIKKGSLEDIKQNIINNHISYLQPNIEFDLCNNACASYSTFVGIPLDILTSLLYILNKFNNVSSVLELNFINNKPLTLHYNAIGIMNDSSKNYLNFEILWSYHKIFYPVNFETIFKQQLKSNKQFIIIPLGIEYYNYTHANYLIYDSKTNEIERFEPNGSHNPNKLNYNPLLLDSLLAFKFKSINDITYIGPRSFLPKIGFQRLDTYEKYTHSKISDPKGFCAVWSIWYVDMRLQNPTISRLQLVEKIIRYIKLNNISFRQLIRNYAELLTKYRDTILATEDIDINDWISSSLSTTIINNINNYISNIIKHQIQ